MCPTKVKDNTPITYILLTLRGPIRKGPRPSFVNVIKRDNSIGMSLILEREKGGYF